MIEGAASLGALRGIVLYYHRLAIRADFGVIRAGSLVIRHRSLCKPRILKTF